MHFQDAFMKLLMQKITKGVLVFLVVLFLIIYTNKDNYYKEEQVISNEAIERFEKDLKEGKTIDPANYMNPKKDYNNKISKTGLKVSSLIEKGVNKVLSKLLDSIRS